MIGVDLRRSRAVFSHAWASFNFSAKEEPKSHSSTGALSTAFFLTRDGLMKARQAKESIDGPIEGENYPLVDGKRGWPQLAEVV